MNVQVNVPADLLHIVANAIEYRARISRDAALKARLEELVTQLKRLERRHA